MKPAFQLISLITIYSIFFINKGYSQETPSSSYTTINEINIGSTISKKVSSAYVDLKTKVASDYLNIQFEQGLKHSSQIPDRYVTKNILLKFNLTNTSDSVNSIYFYPGLYYTNIQLYKEEGSTLNKLPRRLPKIEDSLGFRLITIAPFDSITIIAELTFLKTYVNTIQPHLINVNHIDSFITQIKRPYILIDTITYFFCGLLLMMILFSMSNFFQGANKEFLYYSGYVFFLGSMLLTKAFLHFRINNTAFFLESYFDFILMGVSIIFYMVFMKIFLTTKSKYPFLYKLYNTGIIILIAALLSFTYFHYYTQNFVIENQIENITKLFLLILVFIFLLYSLNHWKDKLLRYLFWGNFCLLLFSIISFTAVIAKPFFTNLPGIFKSSMFYYELGIFLELVFFITALNYKNNKRIIAQTKEREQLRAQNKLKEYEKKIAVYKAQQDERQRISADMHDELGSGMTVIRLMSEIARNKMKENTPIEIDKISASADEVLNKMNAIIWSMNSENDTLDSLISYIRSYTNEYFDNTQIACAIKIPDIIKSVEISGDKRRNLFLSLKESLNNVMKHANATSVEIVITINNDLQIEIIDDGIGLDKEKIRQFGNGLKNIAKRMESIGGSFTIENENGTVSILKLPL